LKHVWCSGKIAVGFEQTLQTAPYFVPGGAGALPINVVLFRIHVGADPTLTKNVKL
jgi:hypothetical protein